MENPPLQFGHPEIKKVLEAILKVRKTGKPAPPFPHPPHHLRRNNYCRTQFLTNRNYRDFKLLNRSLSVQSVIIQQKREN